MKVCDNIKMLNYMFYFIKEFFSTLIRIFIFYSILIISTIIIALIILGLFIIPILVSNVTKSIYALFIMVALEVMLLDYFYYIIKNIFDKLKFFI